jgi:anti-sigma28 factor (negative regulator of flagellin synthesis)
MARKREQEELRKKMGEAKNKMINLVERFFSDFEKEVEKSILSYNESMNDNYLQVNQRIAQLKQEIHEKNASLGGEKVLRTLISFHAKGEKQICNEQVASLRARIDHLDTQRVDVVCQPTMAQDVVDGLGSYIHLAFQNWQN